ncbi:MAG: TRAP transporter large permease [Burkholderiaceae bacterium]|nr:TRAP transporter large permease [Burkholderiaceae bacterium]
MFETLGIFTGIAFLFVSLFVGVPVFAAMGLSGLVGSLFFVDLASLLDSGHLVWGGLDSFSLLAMPGFVLMGNLYFHHDFGRDLFNAAANWLGHIRGGLVIAATALGAGFGFICGSAAAGTATIGSVVIPEVEKRGYDRRLSLGAIAIGGSLSSLIPPSIVMIIYASLSQTSLGSLFFAGIVPGLILTVLIAAYVYVRAVLDRSLCPVTPAASWRDRARSLLSILPVAVAFFVIFGGMYAGVWSAIEAAPIGAVVAFLTCIAYRRLTWRSLDASIHATLKICAMVYMIILSAHLLNYFVFVSKLDRSLVALVGSLDLPGWAVMSLVLVALTVLGCVFDVMALIIIATAVYLPIVELAGYDPVWFGIILVLACELALITPPVGVNLFIVKDLAPADTSTADVIRGALPYVALVWVLFAVFIAFPEIVLWLPSALNH